MKRMTICLLSVLLALVVLPGCGNTAVSSGSSSESGTVDGAKYLSSCRFTEDESYGGVYFSVPKDWEEEMSTEGELFLTFSDDSTRLGTISVKTALHGQTCDAQTAWDNFFSSGTCEDYDSESKNGIELKYAAYQSEEMNVFVAYAQDPNSDKGFILSMSFNNEYTNTKDQNTFFNRFTDTLSYNPAETTVDYKDWWASKQGSSQSTTAQAQPKGFAEATLAQLGTFDEATMTGTGDGVVDIPSPGIPCLMEIHNSGSSNFAVHTVDASGENVDLLINEIGQYDGVVTDYTDYATPTMLSIHSSGNWSVTFRPMSSMQKLDNGAQLWGDNVVYIDESSLSKVSIVNNGESNFVVKAIGMDKSDLLVNEIGNYMGTVIWNQPQSFFIVHSSGQWTISW